MHIELRDKYSAKLFMATKASNYQTVKYILENNIGERWLNTKDTHGKTALHYAALQKDFNLIGLFGAFDADLNIADNEGFTAQMLVDEHVERLIQRKKFRELSETLPATLLQFRKMRTRRLKK